MIFLAATGNAHKVKEFERILAPLGIEIKTAKELHIELPETEESGTSFEENAVLKAKNACRASGYPSLADDSGLCVDALSGAPGLYSSRYSVEDGAEKGDDRANNAKLLAELSEVPAEERSAHFVCAAACAFPNGDTLIARGECSGYIAFEERGKGGFGYDPLFLSGLEKGAPTFAEISPSEKDAVSHRSRAFFLLSRKLKEYLGQG